MTYKTIPYTGTPLSEPQKKRVKDWIKALRSGDYKQTKGMLCSKDMSYCCLGVCSEIQGVTKELDNSRFVFHYPEGDESSGMSDSDWMYETYGFRNTHKFAESSLAPGVSQSLHHLNDIGATFAQIADVIEAVLITGESITFKINEDP
jgi:hypothetical protein